MLEDSRTCLLELLVVSNIEVYRAVHEHLQPLSLDQAGKISSNRRAPSTANPSGTVGYS